MFTYEWLLQHVGTTTVHSPSPFGRWMNATLLHVEREFVAIRMEVRPEMGNPIGGLHGGVAAAVLDEVIGMMLVTLDAEFFYTSVNLSVDFLGNIRTGEPIIAKAKVIRKGNKIVNTEGTIEKEDGTLLAKATSNLVLTSIKTKG